MPVWAGHRVWRLSGNYVKPCINCLSFTLGLTLTSLKNNFEKKHSAKYFILNAEDNCIDTPTFIKKVKLAKK